MSQETCPTVLVESENGPFIMNESDFDPKIHKKVGEKKARKPAAKKVSK